MFTVSLRPLFVDTRLAQKIPDTLGKNLVNNRTGSCVNAADNPVPSPKIIIEDHPIPLHSDPVKSLKLSFRNSDQIILVFF